MIILGDQFPLNGGFLRRKALREAMKKGEMEKEEIRYDLHDVDAPWRQDGAGKIMTVKRWTDYWSLGMRNPLALSVPGVGVESFESVNASLGLPAGLSYLIGPITTKTIASEGKSEIVLGEVKLIIKENISWLQRLAVIAGKDRNEAEEKKDRICRLVEDSLNLREMFEAVGRECAGEDIRVESTAEIFREDKIEKMCLPRDNFWALSDACHRHNLDEVGRLGNYTLVPKGIALFLDFSRRGYWTGFTGCGYLDEMKKLRDRYLPRQPVKLVKICFDWALEEDVIELLISDFVEKKRRRGKGIPQIDSDELGKVKDYWRARPTELACYFLGGSLETKIERIVI